MTLPLFQVGHLQSICTKALSFHLTLVMVLVLESFPGTFYPLLFLTRTMKPEDLFKHQKNLKTEPHVASLFSVQLMAQRPQPGSHQLGG